MIDTVTRTLLIAIVTVLGGNRNIIPRDAFGEGGGQHLVEIEHYSVAYFHCFSVQSKCSAGLLLKVGLVHAVLTL